MKTQTVKLDEKSPIDFALEFYAKHSQINFFEDLADHLRTGVVIARPTCFGMAKLVWIKPPTRLVEERAWFVRFAVGRLEELLTGLPCQLDWIAFCRRGKEKIHVWPLKRLLDLAYRRKTQ